MSAVPDLSVYLVTDAGQSRAAGRDVLDTVAAAVRGGVRAVQIREKELSAREFLALVIALSAVLPDHVALIVNDRVDVFLAAQNAGARVDGMHVGQGDLPAGQVRALIGPDALLGISAATEAQITAAATDPARVDHIGIGALHTTQTKQDAPPALGHERVAALLTHARAARHGGLPAVVIGGVQARDLPALRGAGAAGAAVVSAICRASDPESAARELRAAWDHPGRRA
ncbi:thiamine phosphate synthase [Mycetocola spongiae]|nr:thiamine phosphate synthase [Mycetocola spongiae]UCR87863.1 thiamine phosphate synthase [Mycetocola spongiae]